MPDKPFPWYCKQCKKATVQPRAQRYEFLQKHDGRTQRIVIENLPIPTCSQCGYQTLDRSTLSCIAEETYKQLGLLTPNQIRKKRESLGLTQQRLQELLGLGGNTLSRWETGHVYQSRALDRFLRLFFASDQSRRILERQDCIAERGSQENAMFERQFPYAPPSSRNRKMLRPPMDVFAAAYQGN